MAVRGARATSIARRMSTFAIAVILGVAASAQLAFASTTPSVDPTSTSKPSTRAPQGPAPTSKYYIVGKAVNGQREYPYAIAVKTLGDGRRYREIFELNRDRPQPGGARMIDPLTVEPGWILVLPPDARGSGVTTGALPSPTPTAGGPTADAMARQGHGSPMLSPVVWLSMAVLLLIAGVALRRTRHQSAPASFQHTASPVRDEDEASKIALRPGKITKPGRPAARTPLASAPPGTEPAGEPQRPARPQGRQTTALLPLPARRPEENRALSLPVTRLTTDLVVNGEYASLHLTGARPDGDGPTHAWLAPGEHPPSAGTGIIFGHNARGRLWINLTRVPDALTITGDTQASLRSARALIEQLWGTGLPLTVIGEALSSGLPPGCRRIDSLAMLPEAVLADAQDSTPHVVACIGLPGESLTPVHDLLRAKRRVVALIVGHTPAARWSLRIGRPSPASEVST